jgi:hypothetical protein
MPDSVE